MAGLTVPMLIVLDYSWHKGINFLQNQRFFPLGLSGEPQVLQETKNQSLQVERFDTHLMNLYCVFLLKWQKYFSFICCVCLRFESPMERIS